MLNVILISLYSLKRNTKSRCLLCESIKIEKKNDPLNIKQNLLICLKNKKEIPIYTSDFFTLNEIENKASKLAYFLNVPIKTIK
jgi:hypothetical protein